MLERHAKGQIQSPTANSASHLPAILGAQGELPGFLGGVGGLDIVKEVSPPTLLDFRWWVPLPPGGSASAYTWPGATVPREPQLVKASWQLEGNLI